MKNRICLGCEYLITRAPKSSKNDFKAICKLDGHNICTYTQVDELEGCGCISSDDFALDTAAGLKADTIIIDEATFARERDAKLLTGFIDVLSREMCLNKEIAAKLADDYLNIKSLTSKEYL